MAAVEAVLVYRDVMIAMRDGKRLATDIYIPSYDGHAPAPGRLPVMVTRTPYGRAGFPGAVDPNGALSLARRGYVVAVQDVRGLRGSEGTFTGVMENDGVGKFQDGYDTIEWLARQPWSNGSIGAWGVSYLGHTTIAAALAAPPHLKAGISMQPATDVFTEERFIDGAFRIEVGFWTVAQGADLISRLPESQRAGATAELQQFVQQGDRAYLHMPITDIVFQRKFPALWSNVLKHRDDPSYFDESATTRERAANVQVPLLHIGAWFDPFVRNSIRHFELISANAKDASARAAQRVIIGPWRHGGFGEEMSGETRFPGAAIDTMSLITGWSEHWVKGGSPASNEARKLILYVMGENRWRAEPSWPVPGTTSTPFYLRSAGGLSTDAPASSETADSFIYDPRIPYTAPGTAAGMNALNSFILGENVLVYTGPRLTEAVEATGWVTAKLYASSSATDTDWFVELHDVTPEGRSLLVTEGICRARYRRSRTKPEPIIPNQVEPYELNLRATSIVFKPGHRIRVVVTSGKFPYLERHPNKFVDLNTCTEKDFEVARQTIWHDAAHPSAVYLPLVKAAEHTDWIDNPAPPKPSELLPRLIERSARELATA